MYNATEQFAELNKVGVAQATKLAALALENTEKLARLNLSAAKVVLAQGVEGATATTSVKAPKRGFRRSMRSSISSVSSTEEALRRLKASAAAVR